MRNLIATFICVIGAIAAIAQEASFAVTVSSDTILVGNYFEVKFSIENGESNDFQAPLFQGATIVSGPNLTTSFSLVNGASSQSKAYTYYIQPEEEGLFFVEPASVELDGNVVETEPVPIVVLPNPEGIISPPKKSRSSFFDFDPFADDPIFSDPFSNDPFFNQRKIPRALPDSTIQKKPKKKRKIYKM